MSKFNYAPMFQLGNDETEYRKLDGLVKVENIGDREIVIIEPSSLSELAKQAFSDVSFYLRTSHLDKVAAILDDPEASDNDRYVAATLLKNSMVAAEGELPTCQDTGTAIIVGYKGENVYTGADDKRFLSKGVYDTYQEKNLRYSQMAPIDMFQEINTGSNLPAQIDIMADKGSEYNFLFVAKGGGSANKSYLYQQTKALLNDTSLKKFIEEKLFSLGTAACPPYHIAIVIGGTSAELNQKTVKLASVGYYDNLPTSGDETGRAYRDTKWEEIVNQMAQNTRVGAQFGGKYLAHDIRVIRLPRHAASCPVGIGVSCSADRNIKGKITKEGVFLEQLEMNPEKYRSKVDIVMKPPVEINIDDGMESVLDQLSKHSIGTRLKIKGTFIVARDIAHAKINELIDEGKEMPEYFKKYPVYYAGPAKTPKGMPSGSFGPTTANRMDQYVDKFQKKGGSMIMVAKGNRSKQVTDACNANGGFYLGSIGGPAAILAKESIKSVEVIDFDDLGMEAVRKIEVENFPAFIICDDKGNNIFANLN